MIYIMLMIGGVLQDRKMRDVEIWYVMCVKVSELFMDNL